MDFKKRRGPDCLTAAVWTTEERVTWSRSSESRHMDHLRAFRAYYQQCIGLHTYERSELFLRHFKNSLNGLIQSQFVNQDRSYNVDILCS